MVGNAAHGAGMTVASYPSTLVTHLVLAIVLTASTTAAAQGDAAQQAAQRLDRFAARPELSSENRFLHEQAAALLERWRQAPPQSFLAGRMELAYTISSMRANASSRLETSAKATTRARRQDGSCRGIWSALISGCRKASIFRHRRRIPPATIVVAARHLYQVARSAYHERDYGRVRLLSQAARDVLDALEMLAQAGRGVPDPPRIPD